MRQDKHLRMARRVSSTIAILILCSVIISCKAAHDPPDGEMIFNVLSFRPQSGSADDEETTEVSTYFPEPVKDV